MSTNTDTPFNVVVEKQAVRATLPPMYQVVLLNDDYTPMDFVVEVLQKFFAKTEAEATVIMLQVHHKGRGACGIYSRDVAATRIARVAEHAWLKQHPLQCIMEPV